MGFIVTNYETLDGKVCDTTKRVFTTYGEAERRFLKIVDSVFEETHPQGELSDNEYADQLSDFVCKHVDGDIFNYEQNGHTYSTTIDEYEE